MKFITIAIGSKQIKNKLENIYKTKDKYISEPSGFFSSIDIIQ